MKNKILIGVLMLVSLNSSSQQSDLIYNSDFNLKLNEVKKNISFYIEEYNDLIDYKVIVDLKVDTIQIYIGSYTNKRGAGFNEPFGSFELNDKRIFLFMKNGIKWKYDSKFPKKPEFLNDDYPIWLITITKKGMLLKKGVENPFSEQKKKNNNIKYKAPIIDTVYH